MTYLAATHHLAHMAAQQYDGPCQPAASSLPGRQGGDTDKRELATAPLACRFARGRAGRPPRRPLDPLDTFIHSIASPSLPSTMADAAATASLS